VLTILRNLASEVKLDTKKSRPLESGRKTYTKLYNNGAMRVKSKRIIIPEAYKQGYQDALIFDWSKVPLQIIFEMIDGYKLWAVKTGNVYFAGLAKGANAVAMRRTVSL